MKKRTMEKEHQAEERRKKVLMEIAGAVVVLTVIVSIGLSHLGTDKVNTSAGVKAIKKLEKADVSEVETKISNIEKEEKQANRGLAEPSVVRKICACGDSRRFDHNRFYRI